MNPLSRLLAAALCSALAACATVPREVSTPVEVGIVALNDFHGALEPPRQAVIAPDGRGGSIPVPAGGAAWLASAIDGIRAKYPNHLTVAAGDLISGSPLVSSLYLDEPAIGVLNRIGLDYSAVGNHEFDRGREEILRIQNGGCVQHTKRQPCAVEPFAGARFGYLAASTLTERGRPLLPATALRSFGSGGRKVKIGLIGLTLRGTAQIVSPGGITGLTFADEAATINAHVPRLKAQGADAVVVLIHQGGEKADYTNPNDCAGFSGDIRPILDRLDDRVDLVVSGHTHRAYVCDYGTLNPAKRFLLTSAGDKGRLVTDIRLKIDPAAGRVVDKTATNVIVQSEPFGGADGKIANTSRYPRYVPRPDVAAYVAKYVAATREYATRPVGAIAGPIGDRTVAGQLIADAQLAATRTAGAQISLMNPGGVRAALVPRDGGVLTFGDIYAVQPFGNELVTGTLSGAEIRSVIEQSLDDEGQPNPLIPSAGLTFSYDLRRPVGDRTVDLRLEGQPLDPTASYRVTASDFLAGGGDGLTVLKQMRDLTPGGVDLDALEAWVKADTPRAVPAEPRAINLTPPLEPFPAG